MKQTPDDLLKKLLNSALSETSRDKEVSEFYFDDEPLECILYGEGAKGPSSADLFGPARKYVQDIVSACREGKVHDMISVASELVGSDFIISAEMCYSIVQAIGSLTPYYPNPVMKHDFRPLKPLIDKIWATALETKDVRFQDNAGTPVFRWYEHHGMYEEARQVLSRLKQISREHGNRNDEAIHLNNLGFEYFLEKRWKDAIPYFEEAARIFKETDNTFQHANVRSNYWLSRFADNDFNDLESAEGELEDILKRLAGSGGWTERKPLILQAKIEEQKGNINSAIGLVEKAIESAKKSNTRYPEIDKEYLENLRKTCYTAKENSQFLGDV